jgi:hypothetical protein
MSRAVCSARARVASAPRGRDPQGVVVAVERAEQFGEHRVRQIGDDHADVRVPEADADDRAGGVRHRRPRNVRQAGDVRAGQRPAGAYSTVFDEGSRFFGHFCSSG